MGDHEKELLVRLFNDRLFGYYVVEEYGGERASELRLGNYPQARKYVDGLVKPLPSSIGYIRSVNILVRLVLARYKVFPSPFSLYIFDTSLEVIDLIIERYPQAFEKVIRNVQGKIYMFWFP